MHTGDFQRRLLHLLHTHARCIPIRLYGNFGRGITEYMIIYGVHIQFWPTLEMMFSQLRSTPEVYISGD